MKEEFSAGGVVYKTLNSTQTQFLIGKHSGYHKWVLPKGLVEKGETPPQAALREVEEEVGVKAKLISLTPIGTTEYFYYADLGELTGLGANQAPTTRRIKRYQENGGTKVKVKKTVVFYLMELEAEQEQFGWEMEDRRWVTLTEGLQLLAFKDERRILCQAAAILGLPLNQQCSRSDSN